MQNDFTRRAFLSQSLAGVSAAWMSAHWPAIVGAADHAHRAAQSSVPAKFEFFSSEQAVEIDAIASCIIPTTDTPGAHEAGIVYFIDRALATFWKDDQKTYRDGLAEIQAKLQELFPGSLKFADASPDQKNEILRSLEAKAEVPSESGWGLFPKGQSFFETVRAHTITGFLIDPDSGDNRDGAGWKLIGRDPDHIFQPPFGYYDKDYPGWQPNPSDPEKTK